MKLKIYKKWCSWYGIEWINIDAADLVEANGL